MTFVKGQPRHPNAGRRKGTPNKATLFRVEDFFLGKGIEPLDELMKLMPMLRSDVQAKVWLDIISYYNVKPKADDGTQAAQGGPDIWKLISHLPSELTGPLIKAINELAQDP